MLAQSGTDFGRLMKDREEAAISMVLNELRGGQKTPFDEGVEANLLDCATTAVYHARRMGFETRDGVDALAAVCLVLGERRRDFFENVFLKRMMENPRLTPNQKLNRIVEIVIGTIPRPRSRDAGDDVVRETA